VCVYVCVCVCVCVHVYMYVCMCVYTCVESRKKIAKGAGKKIAKGASIFSENLVFEHIELVLRPPIFLLVCV